MGMKGAGERKGTMQQDFTLVIDGKEAVGEAAFPVVDPALGAPFAQCPAASSTQLEAAIAAARRAFPGWSARADSERKAAVSAMADIIEAHAAELAEIVTREQGKPLGGIGSQWEMGGAVVWARHAASLDLPVETIQDDAQGKVTLHRKPLGVVGSITPWNYPILIAIWHIMPAIRAGNCVVLKPSPLTPLATLRLGALLQAALPPGVLNVVAGEDALGAEMSRHPGIDKIVFTGSTATGRRVMESAAPTLKRLTLELGGNDAAIVLADADLDASVEKIFWGAFLNNGQTCAAIKRLYVHEAVHDALCDKLAAYAAQIKVGVGLEADSQLGPLQNARQFERVRMLVDAAKADGARVLLGGEAMARPGCFYPVTLLADCREGMALVDEEQFGPALPILRFASIDEAVARANACPLGLGGSVWTRDVAAGRAIAARLECGSVWINAHGMVRPDAPFGGVKQSGIGVEFGQLGLAEFTSVQVVHA